MKEGGETVVGHELVLLSISGDLVSVHADHGHLDGATEVEVVVAEVIGGGLEAVLVHA